MGKLNEAAKVSVQAFTDGTNVVTKHSVSVNCFYHRFFLNNLITVCLLTI